MSEENKKEGHIITTKFDGSKIRVFLSICGGIGVEIDDTDRDNDADTAVAILNGEEVNHLLDALRDAAKLPPSGYTFAEYARDADRTVSAGLDPEHLLLNAALGLTGEAGEVLTAAMELAVKAASMADLVKKVAFHGHPLDEGAKAKLKKEGGDVLWYLALIARVLETTLGDMAKGNVEKLKARYPEGFSTAASLNRKPEKMAPIVLGAGAFVVPRPEDKGKTLFVAHGDGPFVPAGVVRPLVHRRFGLSGNDEQRYRSSCGVLVDCGDSTPVQNDVTCPDCLRTVPTPGPTGSIIRHIATAGGSACGLTVRDLTGTRGILVGFEDSPNCPDCLRQPVRVAHALGVDSSVFRCGEPRPENYNPTPAVTAVSVLCRKCWPTP